MVSVNPVFADGGNSNKAPCFTSEYYDFYEICMWMYLKVQGEEIWDIFENGPFVPTMVINNIEQVKVKSSRNNDDKWKVLYDKKLKDILAYAHVWMNSSVYQIVK